MPPTPPIFEDFQGAPQLSLFPRAGAYRPANDDEQGLQFWNTYIDHLMRTSGPTKTGGEADNNIAFGFRAIKGLDSVGVFSPIAVNPGTTYEVSARLTGNLAEGATAGIGLLEFNEFLWLGEQYPEALVKKHQIGRQLLSTATSAMDGLEQKATFTTNPKTHMIHLIFYRDGTQDRNPVLIDDIGIKEVSAE